MQHSIYSKNTKALLNIWAGLIFSSALKKGFLEGSWRYRKVLRLK
jgi:hypothetical protein